MKKMIIPMLAVALMAGCGKEKELKDSIEQSLNNSMGSKGITMLKKDLDTADKKGGTPVVSLLPCSYYPPGSPYSCNYVATDDPMIPFPSIGYQNGYLVFNTLNDFVRTYDILDSLEENYTGYDFAMGLFGGDLDKIDSLLDLRGVDETQPLRDFEKRFTGFASKRKDVETRENAFLDNGGDPSNPLNPENLNFNSDDVFRTLLNKEGAIVIENVMFKLFDNGVTYAVMNNNLTLLNKLSHPENYGLATYPEYFSTHTFMVDTNNVKLLTWKLMCEQPREMLSSEDPSCGYHKGSSSGDCKLWYNKPGALVYDNYKRVAISKIGVYNLFFYDAGISKIRNYKIKKNGRWKPTRTYLSAYVSESGCSTYNKQRSTKYRRFRRCVKRDVTVIPAVGGLFRGIKWMAENINASASGDDYYRFFKTATNHVFYGRNSCNGLQQNIVASW